MNACLSSGGEAEDGNVYVNVIACPVPNLNGELKDLLKK